MEIATTILVSLLSGGVVSVIISSLFYPLKLRNDLKYKEHNVIASEIGESLNAVFKLTKEASTIEIYKIDELLHEEGSNVNFTEPPSLYPAILNDFDSFKKFMEETRECLKKSEYLPRKIALNILFINRYVSQLSVFLSLHGGEADMQFWGAKCFYIDIFTWRNKMEKMVVKALNRHKYKLYPQNDSRWNRLREKEFKNQYKNTVLNYLITGEGKFCKDEDMVKLKHIIDDIEKQLSSVKKDPDTEEKTEID